MSDPNPPHDTEHADAREPGRDPAVPSGPPSGPASGERRSARRGIRLAASAAVSEALANLTPRTADRGAQAALAWPAACGDPLARFTRPLGFEEGLLVVGVAGRVWRDVLYQERKLVIARLRQRVPGLRGFRLVDLPELPPSPPTPTPAPTPTRPDTADIADAGLRAAMDRLLTARDARR